MAPIATAPARGYLSSSLNQLFWMVQCCGVLLELLEHRGDPVVHNDGDRSSALKVKGGGMASIDWGKASSLNTTAE